MQYGMKNRDVNIPPNLTALRLIDEQEVASIYGFKLSTLRNWRSHRLGPAFLKINGKMVRYRVSDIEDYLSACVEKTLAQHDEE